MFGQPVLQAFSTRPTDRRFSLPFPIGDVGEVGCETTLMRLPRGLYMLEFVPLWTLTEILCSLTERDPTCIHPLTPCIQSILVTLYVATRRHSRLGELYVFLRFFLGVLSVHVLKVLSGCSWCLPLLSCCYQRIFLFYRGNLF